MSKSKRKLIHTELKAGELADNRVDIVLVWQKRDVDTIQETVYRSKILDLGIPSWFLEGTNRNTPIRLYLEK